MILLCRILISTALLGSVASTLSVYPHQLAYFNEASGGPWNGHKHLLGSNLDWGQDFIFVEKWMNINGYDIGNVDFVAVPAEYDPRLLFGNLNDSTEKHCEWKIISKEFSIHPKSQVEKIRSVYIVKLTRGMSAVRVSDFGVF